MFSDPSSNIMLCNVCESSRPGLIISQYVNGGIDDPDQQMILEMSYECNALIVGGPGSGKTLLALIRAKQASMKFNRVLLLVYNRPLRQLFNLDRGEFSFEAKGYHAWLYHFYREVLGLNEPPKVAEFKFDWDKVWKDIERKNINNYYDYVLVDEGQDFPLELISILKKISRNMMVFMDPGQTFSPDSDEDSEDDLDINERCEKQVNAIKKELDVPEEGSKRLTKNFRNTKLIFEFARMFSSDETFDTSMDCTNTQGLRPVVYHVLGGLDEYRWDKVWDAVARHVIASPGKKFGVVLSNIKMGNRAIESLSNKLEGKKISLHKRRASWEQPDVDLDSDVLILSVNTVKGLGFDSVFLVYVKGRDMENAGVLATLMHKYYVSATRAKTFLGVVCSARDSQIQKFFSGTSFDIQDIR